MGGWAVSCKLLAGACERRMLLGLATEAPVKGCWLYVPSGGRCGPVQTRAPTLFACGWALENARGDMIRPALVGGAGVQGRAGFWLDVFVSSKLHACGCLRLCQPTRSPKPYINTREAVERCVCRVRETHSGSDGLRQRGLSHPPLATSSALRRAGLSGARSDDGGVGWRWMQDGADA